MRFILNLLNISILMFTFSKQLRPSFFLLASASADMTIKLWDFQGYENLKTLHGNYSAYFYLNIIFI